MHTPDSQRDLGIGQQPRQFKRRYQRTDVADFIGNLADGKKVFGGMVENISTGGFEMTNVPQSFSSAQYLYNVVLSGGGKHYKMLVKPCWRKKKGISDIVIGFKILDASWEWVAFTQNQVPERRVN